MKVLAAEASCLLICWGITLWISTTTDVLSQEQCDNTSAETRADFVAKDADTKPGSSCVGDIHESV